MIALHSRTHENTEPGERFEDLIDMMAAIVDAHESTDEEMGDERS